MFDLSELNKLKRTRDKRAIPTVALYLNENNEYTGKYEVFESEGEASKSTGIAKGSISNIINQKNNRYTSTHKDGRRVTFVNANATQKEIYKHLKKINANRIRKSVTVGVIYLDENNEPTGEYEIFESIVNQKRNKYTVTHKNGRKVTFVPANSTKEDIKKHLKKINANRIRKPVAVKMIYIDENNEPTDKYEVFKSRREASRATSVHSSVISNIINQKNNRYTATHRNGRRVTFVNANATQKEIYKHLKRIKEIENDTSPISVKMIYLDENNEPIGEYEIFESRAETSRATDINAGHISSIINQKNNRYTATHRNGRRVTFVNANATQKEIYKHLKRIKEIENDTSPISVKMIYLDENNEPIGEYEIFESEHEASRITGVTNPIISNIINQKRNRYTATHKNGRTVTFVRGNATKEEIKNHIERIKDAKQAI